MGPDGEIDGDLDNLRQFRRQAQLVEMLLYQIMMGAVQDTGQ